MPVRETRVVQLPQIGDARGNLSVLESGTAPCFEIQRFFYLYDVPVGAERGGHALKTCEQLIIAACGSFTVNVDDGSAKRSFTLSEPDCGLYLPPMLWREITNFSAGSVCMVLASARFDEADYLRTYQEFKEALSNPVAEVVSPTFNPAE